MKVDRALFLAGAAGAFGSLDTALNIAFPDLVAGFDIEVGQLQWVVISFVLTFGGLLLAAGQLGDRVGHQRMMTFGAAGSVLAMAACALAPTFGLFIAARVFQGLTTAAVMAAGPALASLAAGPAARGRAIGVFQLSAGIGGALGPLIGGPLVNLGGWPTVFWFRVPIAIALLLLARSVAPDRTTTETPTDIRGAILTALALAGGLLVVSSARELGLGSVLLWLAVALTVGITAAYRAHSRRISEPIINLRLFRDRRFATANLLNLTAHATMFVSWLLLPALLVNEIGLSTLQGGVVLAASPAAMALVSPLAGRWSDRSRPERPVIAGLATEMMGLWLLASLDEQSSAIAAGLAMATIGLGLGLFAGPNMTLVMSALPTERQGVASGLALLTRIAGIIVGVAGSRALFDELESDRGFVSAFGITATVNAIVTGGALVLAVLVATTGNRRSPAIGLNRA